MGTVIWMDDVCAERDAELLLPEIDKIETQCVDWFRIDVDEEMFVPGSAWCRREDVYRACHALLAEYKKEMMNVLAATIKRAREAERKLAVLGEQRPKRIRYVLSSRRSHGVSRAFGVVSSGN